MTSNFTHISKIKLGVSFQFSMATLTIYFGIFLVTLRPASKLLTKSKKTSLMTWVCI